MTDATSGAGILEDMSSPTVFLLVYVDQSLVFCVVFCRSLFVPFLLAIVLSILRFTSYI
jgi:uncharacterized paraquat-inducible protein A